MWTHLAFVGTVAVDGAWAVDVEAAVELLRRASAVGEPLLLLGTAFSFVHLLDHLAAHDLHFELPPGSSALETGGYKGRSRRLPKAGLHALISQRLGISPSHIICEYGMCELSSQAYDRAVDRPRTTHHASRPFRFPPWARVQVVSPETGREVGEGETGLIRVFDLAQCLFGDGDSNGRSGDSLRRWLRPRRAGGFGRAARVLAHGNLSRNRPGQPKMDAGQM